MSNLPSESAPSAADIRRRLLGNEASGDVGMLPRRSFGANLGRGSGPSSRTPLPRDLALPADELSELRSENQELRNLVDQAISQEEIHESRGRQWRSEIEVREHQLRALHDQVRGIQSGSTDLGELVAQIQERDESIRHLSQQVQQLELHLQFAQDGGGSTEQQYLEAIHERDAVIESLTARVAELERQLEAVPPPQPTDEDLAKMADELERERCQIAQIKKELEDEKRLHAEDEADFERQMREMEVQLSKERAEMARQRTELSRLQTEVRAEMESIQRGDDVLRERLANLQQRRPADAGVAGPLSGRIGTAEKRDKDTGFMKRLFGKQ